MYTVEIDELVFSEDFKKIDGAGQKRIIKAVRKKLTEEPRAYGKPLSGQYKGFWKLKVGYRRDTELYKELAKRLNI
jgi:mRNA-degrading endonuclease RelE of RelBE toxin-antitoxin system